MSIFQEIYKASQNKIEIELTSPLSKNFDLTSPDDLVSLIELAYFQYVVGNTNTSYELVKLVSEIKFANDFDIWTWVEYGLILQSTIHKERNEEKLASECTNKITASLEKSNPVNKKVFKRTLNGDGIPDAYKEIEEAHDEESEYYERITLLMKLMLIREMGGGEDFTVERADKEIQENIERLKVLIGNFNQ
jgi:hypothetical protein